MKNKNIKFTGKIIILSIFLFIAVIISVSVGSSSMSVSESLKLIIHKIPVIGPFINIDNIENSKAVIVYKIRGPRIILSLLTGGALAIVGASFQSVFRNPVADPYILGVSSGAALGAAIAIISGISNIFLSEILSIGGIGICALIGAVLTIIFVYKIGTLSGRMSVSSILLTGTAVSTLLSSIMSVLMIYNRDSLEKVYLWTLGSFSAATWDKVKFLAAVSLVIVFILIIFARDLNLLLTGDESAMSLGVETAKIKKIILSASGILTAAVVSASGTIGFASLIIPHCIKILNGSDNKELLPLSYLGGAVFMVICDTLARTIAQPTEIPVGVITAFFGAPYFIYLLYRYNR